MPSRCLSSIISRSNWATAPKRLDEGDAAEQATGGARVKNLAEKIEGLRKKRSQRVGVDDLLGGEDFFELGRRFASPSISVWGPNRRCGPPPRVAPELESSSQSPVMGGFAFAAYASRWARRDAKVRAGCVRTNPMTTETTSPVPHHVEEAVATIAALHAAHHQEARALQKAVSRATSGIAQPATLILTTVAIASWVTLNLALPEFGRAALDPFPFPLLAAVVSTIALYLAAMILMTQRHDDEMATRREQITLELAILSEQKSSKIIALLEEFRRNDPNQGNHRDEVAEALAEPADAHVVLDAIRAAEKAEDGG
jgi:uncharacterized membrane protein